MDDYPVVELELNAKSAERCVDRFFSLLGWPTKAPGGFDRVFEPLGVVVNLNDVIDGIIRIENKQAQPSARH